MAYKHCRCVYFSLKLLPVTWVVMLAWYLYNPIPSNIDESFKYNMVIATVRVLGDVSHLCTFLRLCDERICIRNILSYSEGIGWTNTGGVIVEDKVFDGVPVRVYSPDRPYNSSGGLIYFHGGGFITGSPRGYDDYACILVRRLDLVVVSVDYRRPPEHPAPTPLMDGLTAARYLYNQADRWKVDVSRLGVAGDSAGGNIAAALTILTRDRWRIRGRPAYNNDNDVRFRFQVLAYPLLQGLTQNLPSYMQNDYHSVIFTKRWCIAGVVWTYIRGYEPFRDFTAYQLNETHIPGYIKRRYADYLDWQKLPPELTKDFEPLPYHEEYFEHLNIASDLINPYNFPLMADDLTDLPAMYMLSAQHDTLRDEGLFYVMRLREAGIDVVSDYFKKGWHGMISGLDGMLSFEISKRVMDNITTFIGSHLQ